MKILYGVQGTGQGHISRARAMRDALANYPVEVTWLFSGRPRAQLFDMEPFGHFKHRRGLTFHTEAGKLRYRATVRHNNPLRILKDIRALDLTPYDLVVTDFEPVTAWAAKKQGVPSIGIGHQYAFGPRTPRVGENFLSREIMHRFAPVTLPVGLHWHPYASNILPPILHLPPRKLRIDGHILVYLPFEDQSAVTSLLRALPEVRFIQYASGLQADVQGNVTLSPPSTAGFKSHLATCAGVICNSGFELISECLQWQKPVLTKPLAGQPEQLSNALALQQLGYATVVESLSDNALREWHESPLPIGNVEFPNVAAELARWLAQGCREDVAELSARLWQVSTETDHSSNRSLLAGA